MRWVAVARVGVALLLGAGVGFLVRGDGGSDSASVAPTPTTAFAPSEARRDAVVAPQAGEVPSAPRGGVATIEFTARPGASCQVEVQPGGGLDNRERLPIAVADGEGRVAWRWTVDGDLPAGTAQAVVVCSGGARGQVAIRVV